MRANKPTGSTPQKRPRPETLSSTDGIDVFDDADRQHLLECLKIRKGHPMSDVTQEDDLSRDTVCEARTTSVPRASSTLAARKAARMSSASVMRA